MVRSDNAVYAQLTQLVTPKAVVKMAHELGIRSHLDPFFSIGLGQLAVNPLDMARAYATMADGGRRIDGSLSRIRDRPRVIRNVTFIRSGHTQNNDPVAHQALTPAEDQTLTSILERVVTSGTGTRAALADRPVAGKTGTTDKYGDAWFVGYTPELVVAVWVGYPDELRPMLHEFGGRPVAGGTLPAEIWKQFMSTVLKRTGDEPKSFPYAPLLSVQEKRVVYRNGSWKLANAYCRTSQPVVYYSGRGPTKDGRLPPERGRSAHGGGQVSGVGNRPSRPPAARSQGDLPPAAPARSRPGLVIPPVPGDGCAVCTRHGYARRHEGSIRPDPGSRRLFARGGTEPAEEAQASDAVTTARAPAARSSVRAWRRASPPRRACGSGSSSPGRSGSSRDEARAGGKVTPRLLRCSCDPDPTRYDDLERLRRRNKPEWRGVEPETVVDVSDTQRLRQPTRARAEQPRLVDAAPRAHLLDAVRRLQGAQQDGGTGPLGLADDVGTQCTPYERYT